MGEETERESWNEPREYEVTITFTMTDGSTVEAVEDEHDLDKHFATIQKAAKGSGFAFSGRTGVNLKYVMRIDYAINPKGTNK